MTVQSVLIARYIEQVEDGTHYKGHLNITGVEFDYEVVLKKPIKQFIASKSINSLEELRNVFIILVKRGGVEIPLSEDEYKFFATVLIEFVVSFYHEPQVRETNEGVIGKMARSESPLASAARVSIGIYNRATYNLSLKVCEILSHQKFGCVFIW